MQMVAANGRKKTVTESTINTKQQFKKPPLNWLNWWSHNNSAINPFKSSKETAEALVSATQPMLTDHGHYCRASDRKNACSTHLDQIWSPVGVIIYFSVVFHWFICRIPSGLDSRCSMIVTDFSYYQSHVIKLIEEVVNVQSDLISLWIYWSLLLRDIVWSRRVQWMTREIIF